MQKVGLGRKNRAKRKSMDERHVTFSREGVNSADDSDAGQNGATSQTSGSLGAVDGSEDLYSSGEEDLGLVGDGEEELYDPDMVNAPPLSVVRFCTLFSWK